ncbi:MAG TPA: transglycosylase domain-containing protein [Longimicrobiales bacterium]|nr:transglycosylase domain-containing protein [Longimicrobiales bacterium]
MKLTTLWKEWSTPKRVLLSAATVVAVLLLTGAVWTTLFITGVAGPGCPSVADLRTYRPPQATRLFAADGSVIADLSPQRRVVLGLEDVPPVLREGMIAVEDRRFWEHSGIDFRSVARAMWRNVISFEIREGFSTIPMQLARSVFPERLPMGDKLGRKACEVVLAKRIEGEFQKREILELYLNQIYLGSGHYGVEAAAQGYFGRSAHQLAPEEAALLIALVKSPEGYNPRKHPTRAVQRRNIALEVMARAGVLERSAADAAKRRPLGLAPPPEAAGAAPYFVAAVRAELRDRFGADADVRGLRVFTALDPRLQKLSAEALVAQIGRIEGGSYGQYSHPKGGATADPEAPVLQGMVISLDPATGAVRALVGGRDFAQSQFDRALQAKRQPGSAFKPLVYAAALESGLPATARLETTPIEVDDAGSPRWSPGDHVSDTVETLSVRNALAVSSNNAAVRVGRWVGEDRVAAMGRRLGLSTPIPPYPSIHLGSAEVIPAELVAAFATFGNGGYLVKPTLFLRVEDGDGRVLWEARPSRRQVLDGGVAFLTLTLLEEVVSSGTASVIRTRGFWLPAAGKTGTTNDNKDVWFVGMTPDLVTGVWLGFDRPRPILPGAGGGRLAAPVWADIMKGAYETRPSPAPWAPPANIISAQVDERTGYLATGNCPPEDVRIEYFLIGTEPEMYCPLHPEAGVDGLLDNLWRRIRKVF